MMHIRSTVTCSLRFRTAHVHSESNRNRIFTWDRWNFESQRRRRRKHWLPISGEMVRKLTTTSMFAYGRAIILACVLPVQWFDFSTDHSENIFNHFFEDFVVFKFERASSAEQQGGRGETSGCLFAFQRLSTATKNHALAKINVIDN